MDVFAVPHMRLAWDSLFSQVELKEDRHPLDSPLILGQVHVGVSKVVKNTFQDRILGVFAQVQLNFLL